MRLEFFRNFFYDVINCEVFIDISFKERKIILNLLWQFAENVWEIRKNIFLFNDGIHFFSFRFWNGTRVHHLLVNWRCRVHRRMASLPLDVRLTEPVADHYDAVHWQSTIWDVPSHWITMWAYNFLKIYFKHSPACPCIYRLNGGCG